jgi:hypothetical protein
LLVFNLNGEKAAYKQDVVVGVRMK